jgi:hypothetical protein
MPDRANRSLSLLTMHDVRGGPLPAAVFLDRVLRDGLARIHRSSFPVGELRVEQLEALARVELAERFETGLAALLRMDERTLVLLSAFRGQGELTVAGDEADACARVAADLAGAVRERRDRDDLVPITFWARAPGMPMNPRRMVAAPAWEEIRRNYGGTARRSLDALMAARDPGAGGLLLWHGAPGTGKSTALRALAREWRAWCDVHFIADPDAFLGSESSYLLGALLRTDSSPDGNGRWRLIVLEDAGELLAADARAVAGQAVSRLLNLTDGLLGQGLRALVLVTTNEPIGRLHPAIARPGRTWADVEFPPLTADEANAWLARRGADGHVGGATPLAELFALAAGRRVREQVAVGFSPVRPRLDAATP